MLIASSKNFKFDISLFQDIVMIYTLTLNPAIDRIIEVPHFQTGVTNRAIEECETIGGKSINVSLMLKNLQFDTTALGFLGHENSKIFNDFFSNEKLPNVFLEVCGKTRTNLKIISLETNEETELNGISFNVTENDVRAIYELVVEKLSPNDCLIMSGSLPRNCDPTIYAKLGDYCNEHNILFVVDVITKFMLPTLQYHPFLIKPNLSELSDLFNKNFDYDTEEDEIIIAGKKLLESGAQNVIISAGKKGSILITSANETFIANAASGKVVNSAGAGDSMVAGFVGTFLKTKNFYESFLMGICAGSATAFCKGIASKNSVDELKEQIVIQKK